MAAIIALSGCVTSADEPSTTGAGKADGASAICTQKYVTWVLLDYKPAVLAEPLTSARITDLEALAKHAPCPGELLQDLAWTTWQDVTDVVAFAPYYMQHGRADVAFLGTGAERGDLEAYHGNTTPTQATRDAWRVMKAARPTVSVDRLGMKDWLDLHRVYAELVLSPLPDLALIGQTEGYWTLNAGEAAFLDLVAESRPPQSHAGAYASWMEAYGDVLTHGVSLDQEDDFRAGVPRLGCLDAEVAPCGRERVLDRFAALAPTAAGEEDHEQWMWELALWAPLTASAGALYEADTQRQLDRIDRVRPARLRGARSYQVWLSTVADTAGDPAVLDHSVMPAKPCVEGTAGDADYAAFLAANGYLPAARKTAAAPQHCP